MLLLLRQLDPTLCEKYSLPDNCYGEVIMKRLSGNYHGFSTKQNITHEGVIKCQEINEIQGHEKTISPLLR